LDENTVELLHVGIQGLCKNVCSYAHRAVGLMISFDDCKNTGSEVMQIGRRWVHFNLLTFI